MGAQETLCSRFTRYPNHVARPIARVRNRESEIRRHVLERDLLEAIIALPTDMFYNTGIATYIWIVSNRKPAYRKGKVQLIDASSFWQKMRKIPPDPHRLNRANGSGGRVDSSV